MPRANNPVLTLVKCHGCGAAVELRGSVSGNVYYTCDGKADPTQYCHTMMKYGRKPSHEIKEMINARPGIHGQEQQAYSATPAAPGERDSPAGADGQPDAATV